VPPDRVQRARGEADGDAKWYRNEGDPPRCHRIEAREPDGRPPEFTEKRHCTEYYPSRAGSVGLAPLASLRASTALSPGR